MAKLIDAQNKRLYLAAKERDILIVRARRWKALAKRMRSETKSCAGALHSALDRADEERRVATEASNLLAQVKYWSLVWKASAKRMRIRWKDADEWAVGGTMAAINWAEGWRRAGAVAFGLMGMVEAIRARAPLEHLSEVYRQTSLVAARAEACWDYAEPDLDGDGSLVPGEIWDELVESIRELHVLQRKTG